MLENIDYIYYDNGLKAIDDESINKETVKMLRNNNMLYVGLLVINYEFKHHNFMKINKFICKEKLI